MSALPRHTLDLDPEQTLVLALARAFANGADATDTRDTIAAITPQITSWIRVDALLNVHRLKSLSYHVLRDTSIKDSDLLPANFVAQMRESYSSSFTRTVMEAPILHRIVDAFTLADIPVLSIKGLTLGSWLYEDAALREHDDLDLLVPADMGERSDAVLMNLGYGTGYRPPLYPGESPATASYQDPAGGIPVDLSFDPLHIFWQSTSERRVSFEGWWSRRHQICIGRHLVAIPGPEDQFLQLARHLQFHGYFRVNWSVDVVLLLRRFGNVMDWELIGSEAARHGISGGINRTLELMNAVYHLDLPETATSSLRTGRIVRSLHRRVWPDTLAIPRERTTREQEGTPIAPRFLSPGGVHPIAGLSLFALDPRRRKYFLYLGQRIFPPPSWLRDRYGDGSYPGLLLKHWSGLRSLRRRVRMRRKHHQPKG